MAAKNQREKARPDYEAYQSPELRNRPWLALIFDLLSRLSFKRAITFSAMAIIGWMAFEYLKKDCTAHSLVSVVLIFAIWLIGFWLERKPGAKSTQEASPNPAAQPGNEPDGAAETRRPP